MNDIIRQGRNLFNKYTYHGIEDTALAEFNERVDMLYQDFGYYRPKVPTQKAHDTEFNQELEEIYNDFIKSKDSLIGLFTGQKNRYKQFSKKGGLHEGASKQEYVDYVEEINDFSSTIASLMDFDSEQIHTFYTIGQEKGMSTKEINYVIEKTIIDNKGKGWTTDILALNIRRNLRAL